MRIIKIKFADFTGLSPTDNFIIDTLRKKYIVELSDDPDYLFFSCFGREHYYYDCVKIQILGENLVPDFNVCDYALGFDFLSFGDRYMRLPLYQVWRGFDKISRNKSFNEEDIVHRKFCSIVVSNTRFADPVRERFFRLLSEYKQVDSGGKAWNNVGGPVKDKLNFLQSYKFNIAIENSCALGYTTEKIMDPMLVNSVPIYYGNKEISRDFNPASFINIHQYKTLEDAVERVVFLDTHDEAYLETVRQPWVTDLDIFKWRERLLSFLSNIIEKPLSEAFYTPKYGAAKAYRRNLCAADILLWKLKISRLMSLYYRIFPDKSAK